MALPLFLLILMGGAGSAAAAAAAASDNPSAAAAQAAKGSFIDAVRRGSPAVLHMRIQARLQGPAGEFIQELYAQEDGWSVLHYLAAARERQKEFADIMKALIHIVDPASFPDMEKDSFIALPDDEKPYTPSVKYLNLKEDDLLAAFPPANISFWERAFLPHDPLSGQKRFLRALYDNGSALEFFRHLHYTKTLDGKPLFEMMIQEYGKIIGDARPLFVTTQPSLLELAKERGNLAAYKALRKTDFFSDRRLIYYQQGGATLGMISALGLLLAGSMGGYGYLDPESISSDDGLMSWALQYVGRTAGTAVAASAAGYYGLPACYKAFRNAWIKKNGRRAAAPESAFRQPVQ